MKTTPTVFCAISALALLLAGCAPMAGRRIETGNLSCSTLVEADDSGVFRADFPARRDTMPDRVLGKDNLAIWTRERLHGQGNPALDAGGSIVGASLVPGPFPGTHPTSIPSRRSPTSPRSTSPISSPQPWTGP